MRLIFLLSILSFAGAAWAQPNSIVNKADTSIFLPYKNGVAPFSYKGKMGIIDSLGNVVVPATFTRLTKIFNDGDFAYRFYYNNKKEGILDTAYKVIIPAGKYDDISTSINGFFTVKKGRKYTFVDYQGNEIGKWYQEAGFFQEIGLANVKVESKWGYINRKGELVINAVFDRAFPFCENGLARVKTNGKWGFINSTGTFVIPPIYNSLGCFNNDLAAAQKGSKWGYINSLGQTIIPFEYSSADDFDNFGTACVKKHNRFGYINKQNEVVLPFKYVRAHSFGDNNQNTTVRTKRFHHSISINRKGECMYWCD